MRQFRSDDTSKWKHRYGDRTAGLKSFATETIDTSDGAYYSRIDSAIIGQFTATIPQIPDGTYNLPCALMVMKIGAPTDNWEFNYLLSVAGGIGTFLYPLQRTYSDYTSQIITANPFSDVELTGILSCPAWNGERYGVGLLFGGDLINGAGSLNSVGRGFRGGVAKQRGEGTGNNWTEGTTPNGNGAGAGGDATDSGHTEGGNSGGGGNRTAGGSGDSRNTGIGGLGGIQQSDQNGRSIYMGGGSAGGGSGWSDFASTLSGVNGSGIWITVAKRQEWTGGVNVSGQNGNSSPSVAATGGGAPGAWIAKGSVINVTGPILATPGVGGTCTGSFGGEGGDSGEGVLHVDYGKSVMGGIDATLDRILNPLFGGAALLMQT